MKGYPYLFQTDSAEVPHEKFVLVTPHTTAKEAHDYALRHGLLGNGNAKYRVTGIREMELGEPPQPLIICKQPVRKHPPQRASNPGGADDSETMVEDAGKEHAALGSLENLTMQPDEVKTPLGEVESVEAGEIEE